MDKGRFAAEGSPRQLIDEHSSREVVELRFRAGEHEEVAKRLNAMVARTELLPDRVLLYTADGDATLSTVLSSGFEPESWLVRRSTLEDVFLRLTGRTLID
jgi:lipooligosaccharide transport system ATP-binding protein